MSDIPKISFKKSKSKGAEGFEFLNLKSLFDRTPKTTDHDPFKLHRIGFNALLIIEEGMVNHRLDFDEYQLKAGDCLVMMNNQIHAFDKSNSYKGYLVLMTEEFMQRYFSAVALDKIYQNFNYNSGSSAFQSLYNPQILTLLKEVDLNEPNERQSSIAASLISIILTSADNSSSDSNSLVNSRYNYHFNQFNQLLFANYTLSRDANFYASEIGITYKHLNTVCKECVKQTAKEYIDSFVILEAKRRLAINKDSVKEISFQLGFDEPTNFLKYFKRHTQTTPKTFRSISL